MCFQPNPEIALYNNDPNSALLIMELNGIRTKQTQRGQTIVPDRNGEVKTDDCCVHPDTTWLNWDWVSR